MFKKILSFLIGSIMFLGSWGTKGVSAAAPLPQESQVQLRLIKEFLQCSLTGTPDSIAHSAARFMSQLFKISPKPISHNNRIAHQDDPNVSRVLNLLTCFIHGYVVYCHELHSGNYGAKTVYNTHVNLCSLALRLTDFLSQIYRLMQQTEASEVMKNLHSQLLQTTPYPISQREEQLFLPTEMLKRLPRESDPKFFKFFSRQYTKEAHDLWYNLEIALRKMEDSVGTDEEINEAFDTMNDIYKKCLDQMDAHYEEQEKMREVKQKEKQKEKRKEKKEREKLIREAEEKAKTEAEEKARKQKEELERQNKVQAEIKARAEAWKSTVESERKFKEEAKKQARLLTNLSIEEMERAEYIQMPVKIVWDKDALKDYETLEEWEKDKVDDTIRQIKEFGWKNDRGRAKYLSEYNFFTRRLTKKDRLAYQCEIKDKKVEIKVMRCTGHIGSEK